MSKTDIIFLSIANLPDQSASGLRISSFVDALNLKNHKCYVVGQAAFAPYSHQCIRPGYEVYSLYNSSIKNSVMEKIKAFAFPKTRIARILRTIIRDNPSIYCIFIYQKLPGFTTPYIIRFCKKNHIKLFFDIVEYQIISQQDVLGFFINYIPNFVTVNFYVKKAEVTAISTYLYKFFLKKRVHSVYIPFFFNTENIAYISNNNVGKPKTKTTFLYAGVPQGGRDTIVNAVKGALLLPLYNRGKIELYFAGVNEKQMLKLGLSKNELLDSMPFCHYLGRIRHEKVMDLYKTVDYSLLLKPANKRFSKAGFPTKISESLAAGVPPICNDTGDIGMFIVDNVNGLILKNDSPLEFSKGILRAILISEDDYLRMRGRARETADTKLSLVHYSEQLNDFVFGQISQGTK